jgi:5-methylthioadenosine/S-adenosylhomocysteine deaminase
LTTLLFKDIAVLDETGKSAPHAYVVVDNDIITQVLEAEPRGEFDRVYDGRGKLLMPALYNSHAHIPMTLLRGRGDNLPLDRWLSEAVYPFEDQITEDAAYHATLLGIAEMLRFGVVSFTDMYFFTDARARAVLESGIKCNLSDCIVCMDPEKTYRDLPLAKENDRWIAQYHGAGDGRLLMDMSLHAEYTTTPEIVKSVAAATKEAGLRMQIHVSETKKEVKECIDRHGKTPPVYLAELGCFDVPTTADHCVWLTDEDRAVLAEKHVFVSCCPASNAKLGSGIADIVAMKNAGITLSLGTDGPASNNNHNMFQDLYLLALMQRAGSADPVSLSAEELITIATRNGALSQGRNNCGMIKPGAKADLIVLDIDTPWMQPIHTIADNVVYSAQGSDVVMTMVDGKILYENGVYTTIDIEAEIAKTREARNEILAKMNTVS